MSLTDAILEKYRSLSEYAGKVGFTRQKLNKIVHGQYEPKIKEAAIMSDALGISMDNFANFF